MNKKILLSLMGFFVCFLALAQTPAKGKYYRIVNARYNKVMKENWGSQDVTCNSLDNEDYAQIWMYTTTGGLQNVYTGRYLQNQTNTSTTFKTGQASVAVSFTTQSDGHLGINVSGNQLHCDAASNVVRWNDNGNEANHWTVQAVSLTAEEVQAAREEFQNFLDLTKNSSAYTEKLLVFFTNELCTELKAEYTNMNDADLKAAMEEAGLPVMLQNVAVKVKNNWWNDTEKSTYADKNKYAKDFRVATFKPYSDANNWRDKMNTYAPSFMGNPTGIYAKNKDVIHVFVGNDIPEGATLYLTPLRNHGRIGSRSEGTQLKKGYNAVVATNDSLMYFVNYVVNTIPTSNVNAHTQPIAKISDFPNLDIHIEGGECVGYYQKPAESSAEEDAKYQYLSKNAKNNMYFVVKGETSLFYFKKNTFTSVWPKTIWNSINWFDRVHFWEFGLIGILDDVANGKLESGNEFSKSAHPFNITGGDAFYPTYCNNPTMAIEGGGDQNPHATTFYTSYPGTWGVESSFNAERQDFDTWCTGHEHGHQIQGPYNLESCSESSVNLPSLLVTYMTGFRMGRGGSFADNYNYYQQNLVFGHRDIGMTMRMYWNMFLYYHVAGKKKDFYPTFVKSLREDPMNFSADKWIDGVGHHRATKTWIHMYKKACEAAKEDLTEYFRMWGFFVPCKEVHFGDYTNYYVSLTQKEIDDAIAEVKAKGYPENLQIMFVEDRQLMRERTDIWAHTATGNQKYRPDNGGTWRDQKTFHEWFGDVGDVLTYIDGSANTSKYTYVQSGNKISMNGKGGVGFIVYDKNGNNSYMSNRFNFEIPMELASDGFSIKVINADGTSSEATNGADDASDEEKLAILQAALNAGKEMVKLEDSTGKKVGFYSSEDIATLKALVADAEAAIKSANVAQYLPLANSINNEALRLQTSGCMQSIVPNAMYYINSVRKLNGISHYLAGNASNQVVAGTKAENQSRWAFIPVGEPNENTYYIQNRQNGKFLNVEYDEKEKISGNKLGEADPATADLYKIKSLGDGKFGLRPKDATYINMDPYGGVTIWGDADEGSQWYITVYEVFDSITDGIMNEMIDATNNLVDDVCDYSITENKVALQTTDAAQPGYFSTNQPDAERPYNQIEKAIDGNVSSFFMSNRSNNANTSEYHHLKVDLGSDTKAKTPKFNMSGHISWNYATSVKVYGSNNNKTWTNVATIDGMSISYSSDLIRATTAYRYWRFDVTSTKGKYADNSAYPWFTVKEFEFFNAEENIQNKPGFEKISATLITNCKKRVAEAAAELEKTNRTLLGDYIAYSMLNAAYTNLYNQAVKYDPTVDINDINGTEGEADGNAYDLSGRKVNNANAKGIFIINGKKVVK